MKVGAPRNASFSHDRAGEAKQLLHGARDQRGVGDEVAVEIGVQCQAQHDEGNRGLHRIEPGKEQECSKAEFLVSGKGAAALVELDELAEDVVAGRVAPGVEQIANIVGELFPSRS